MDNRPIPPFPSLLAGKCLIHMVGDLVASYPTALPGPSRCTARASIVTSSSEVLRRRHGARPRRQATPTTPGGSPAAAARAHHMGPQEVVHVPFSMGFSAFRDFKIFGFWFSLMGKVTLS